MSNRVDKMRSAARYLVAASKIPLISYTHADRRITVPAPYSLPVFVTERKIREWYDPLRSFTPGKMEFSILMNSGMDSPADMWVAMRGDTFAELLGAHFEANRERIMGGER